MKWFHRRRLIRLADKLEGKGPYAKVGPVPEHKFDMRYLYAERRGGRPCGNFDPHRCNTVACALGWAKRDPWFKKHGRLSFGVTGDEHIYLFEAASYRGLGGRRVHPSIVAARLREAAQKP